MTHWPVLAAFIAMMRFFLTKKTIAVLLCISTLGIIVIVNSKLKDSARQRSVYEGQETLTYPLTIDLSKNVSFINLPGANNEIHKYRLERVHGDEDVGVHDGVNRGGWEQNKMAKDVANGKDRGMPGNTWNGYKGQRGNVLFDKVAGFVGIGGDGRDIDDNAEDDFGDRVDDNLMDRASLQKKASDLESRFHQFGKVQVSLRNVTTLDNVMNIKNNYLIRVPDPRYPKMIGKVLTKLPQDVRKEMSLNIRMAEAKSGVQFQKISANKQWEIILKVFSANGYKQKLPDVINIGVKKSGTNALGFFLPQHPQIIHSIGNEVHYFDWMYDKGTEYYKSRMGFTKEGQLSFEKTPRYFVTPEAPGRILHDLPKTPKFILCVRDPIARLISDFRHESELKLRKDMRRDRSQFASRTGEYEGLRLKQEILDSKGQVNESNELIRTSLYVKHFKNWLKYYSVNQIIVVDQDKMERDVFSEMRRMEDFLSLRPYFKPSMFYFDDTKKTTCMANSQLGPRNCPAKSTPSVLPKAIIDPETLQKLKDFYSPYNKEFADITNMEFAWAN